MLDFSFNGVSLSSFGGRLLQPPVHTIARRNTTRVKIYGQSGDEIIDNGSYDNVDFSLQIGFFPHLTQYNAQQLAHAVINWLAPLQNGYYVYRDSLNIGYFTNAQLTNFDEIQRELRTLLTATLNFTRVPFWYSDSGATPVSFSNQAILVNPENYPAEPIITIEFTGSSGGTTIDVSMFVNGVKKLVVASDATNRRIQTIDGVRKQHYMIENGQKVYLSAKLPPDLEPGDNMIAFDTSQVTCTITPNWRRL